MITHVINPQTLSGGVGQSWSIALRNKLSLNVPPEFDLDTLMRVFRSEMKMFVVKMKCSGVRSTDVQVLQFGSAQHQPSNRIDTLKACLGAKLRPSKC